MRVPRSTAAVLAGAALLAGACPAGAATLTTDRACYRSGQLMRVTATGFATGAPLHFSAGGSPLRLAPADEQAGGLEGDGIVRVQAPPWETDVDGSPFGGPVALSATNTVLSDNGDTVVSEAQAPIMLVDGFVASASRPRGRSWMLTLSLRGAVELTTVFLHVTRESRGRPRRVLSRRTIALGTPAGPCGTLTARIPAFGARTPPAGRYSLALDLARTADTRADSPTSAGFGPYNVAGG